MPAATTLSPSAAAPPIWNSLNLRLEEPALMTISLFRGAMAAGHRCQALGRADAGLCAACGGCHAIWAAASGWQQGLESEAKVVVRWRPQKGVTGCRTGCRAPRLLPRRISNRSAEGRQGAGQASAAAGRPPAGYGAQLRCMASADFPVPPAHDIGTISASCAVSRPYSGQEPSEEGSGEQPVPIHCSTVLDCTLDCTT